MSSDEGKASVQIGKAVAVRDLEADPCRPFRDDREPEATGEDAAPAKIAGQPDDIHRRSQDDSEDCRLSIEGLDAACQQSVAEVSNLLAKLRYHSWVFSENPEGSQAATGNRRGQRIREEIRTRDLCQCVAHGLQTSDETACPRSTRLAELSGQDVHLPFNAKHFRQAPLGPADDAPAV